MSIFEAIIQGIVQGATEFLPVSSSGHLSLAQHILGVKVDSLLFDILLHLGTLIAVCAVYYKPFDENYARNWSGHDRVFR